MILTVGTLQLAAVFALMLGQYIGRGRGGQNPVAGRRCSILLLAGCTLLAASLWSATIYVGLGFGFTLWVMFAALTMPVVAVCRTVLLARAFGD